MKKRVLVAVVAICLAVGMVAPAALAADIGTLNYTLSTASVNMTVAGTGSFSINVPNPEPTRAYSGVEFQAQLPANVEITSISCNLTDASTSLKEAEFNPGIYGFSCYALSNQFTGDLTCEVNVKYKGSAQAQATLTIQTVKQYVVNGHTRDDWSSTGTKVVTLVPSSGAVSKDANLASLSISPGTLNQTFNQNTTVYTASVDSDTKSVEIFAFPVSGATVSGAGEKTLKTGENKFTITVTAEDKVTTKTYTLTVNRAEPGSKSDARLTSLSISPGSIGIFIPDKDSYTATGIVYANDSVTVTAVANTGATITGDGKKTLLVGPNTVTVTVTSEDKTTTKSYTITITRPNSADGTGTGTGTGSGVTVPPGTVPLAGVFPFTDVSQSDWFYADAYYVWEEELMTGTTSTLFSPNTAVTRGMVVTVLYRAENNPDTAGLDNPFSDVAAGAWYTNAVKWAANKGIVLGYPDGTFKPTQNVSRQELAAVLSRYAGTKLTGTRDYATFTDDAVIAAFAKDPVKTLYTAEIINGKPDNRFDPLGTATRAEFAAMIHRFLVKTKA